MPDQPWSFWRDEAKLLILDEETRMKAIIGFGGGAIALFLAGLFGNTFNLGDVSRTAALCVGAILFPSYLCIDMFYKGRKAGTAIKEARHAAIESLKNPSTVAGTVNHVLEQCHQFIKQGGQQDLKGNFTACQEWASAIADYFRDALISKYGDELEQMRKHDTDFSSRQNEQASAIITHYLNWLEQLPGRISVRDLRPGFTVPAPSPARMTA